MNISSQYNYPLYALESRRLVNNSLAVVRIETPIGRRQESWKFVGHPQLRSVLATVGCRCRVC